MRIYEDYSLLPNNTFGVDVNTRYFVEYESVQELQDLLATDFLKDNKILHIGGGSNLLFIGDFRGVILHSHILGINVVKQDDDYVWVQAGAGVTWDDFVAYCVCKNYGGAENLSLIPGEVGATPIQNIGAYGVEVKELIDTVYTVSMDTRQEKIFTNQECGFGYRTSVFKRQLRGKYIVTSVVYKLHKHPEILTEYGRLGDEIKQYPEATIQNVRKAVIAIRQRKLPEPRVLGNAGSFFINPVIPVEQFHDLQAQYPEIPYYKVSDALIKVPAGWLIEQCGWKGKQDGKVAVHGSQALVLINKGGADGLDIIRLSDKIRESVRQKFGIELTPEVNVIFG